MRQTSFFTLENHIGKVFAPKTGRRKSKRPLSSRHPIHLILHSEKSNLRKNERWVLTQWNRFARKFGVRTYRIVVCGDHLHSVIRLHDFKNYVAFIRAFSGTLARSAGIKWSCRPATRLANWGRDFKRLCQYVKLNFLEANGFLEYQPDRTRRLPHYVIL